MDNEEVVKKVAVGVGATLMTPKIIGLIIAFLIGVLMTVANLVSAVHLITYKDATATVVDIEYNREINVYKPVYEYNYNGQIVRANGFPTTNSNEIIIGSTQKISYNPKNYKQFDIGSKQSTVPSFLFGTMLLVLSSMNLIGFYKGFKSAMKSD